MGITESALQIMVYWFVFGMGIRSNQPIHGIPFIYWLLVGISMWFFVNQGILEGTKSVSMKFNQVAKMNFPLSIIPTYTVTSRFYGHIGLLLIIIGICIVNGIFPSIHIVQLLIYVPMTFFFTASVALFTSTLGIIVRDTQMIMQALLRILFYMSQFYGYLKIQVLVEQLVKLLNLIQFISWLNHIVQRFYSTNGTL